jgi:hypothetical protein
MLNKIVVLAISIFLNGMAVQIPAQAQDAPIVSPTLQKMLSNLPIAGIKEELQGMIGELSKTSCGGNLTGCYMTQSGSLQLYFFTSGSAQQTLLLVVDKSMPMPKLLGPQVQQVLGATSLKAPIISISTSDFELDQIKMPPALQQVVRDNYFNVNTLSFSSGVQLAARANLGGAIKLTMEAMGVKANQLTMRAAVVMPIPTDLSGSVGAGAAMADAMAHGATMSQAGADAMKPEAFVEFQLAPNAVVEFGMPQMRLSDATFFINNALTFGYKGNAAYRGAETKKVLTQFQTPLNPAGAMDLLDFSFRMATPANFTMEDAARVMIAMASPDPRLKQYGGGFIRDIELFKDALFVMSAPLSTVKLVNPTPAPEYRFGDSSKPFPNDDKYFNMVVLGPLADGGPLLKGMGEVNILGQKMGRLAYAADLSGLRSEIGQALTLKLGPLGKVSFKMVQTTAVSSLTREMGLEGNYAGQKVKVSLYGGVPTAGISSSAVKPPEGSLEIAVSASCANPFEIKTKVKLEASTDLAKVFEGEAGINVDPAKIPNCVGDQLEAAYKKIAGEYKNLSGYSADAATRELKKIADTAAEAQRAAEAEAKRIADEYEKTKNKARELANKTSNAATKAFNDAGNAITGLGKKKKRKKAPNPIFDASVFDWDRYYDGYPAVVAAGVDLAWHWENNGFNEGFDGALEFRASFYRARYLDVQALCGATDRLCVVKHWLEYGIPQGRQGNANFSIASYLDYHPDLQRLYYGKGNYEDALNHWFEAGRDEGRKAHPASNAPGPFVGMQRAGGFKGTRWDDFAVCQNQHMIGFRIRSGKRVDGVQFLYPNGWGAVHGYLGNPPYSGEVILPAGRYFKTAQYRSGGSIDALGFIDNTGKGSGMFGGSGGTLKFYHANEGQKIGCMMGYATDEIEQLTFSSTGPR